jgi:2-octaprenyl-6-methoxyphenol hydroxylase
VVANFTCTQPHRGLARQWFRPDGILAWLPLPGQRLSIVWSTHPEYADELCALPPDTLAERVAAAGGYALGTFTPLTAAAAFPLALGRARQVVGPRVALVGDAAHTIHPLAGQGVNLGFGDARALVAALRPGGDAGDPIRLARYARARKEDVWLMQTVCDGLQRLFAAEPPAIGLLRNTGLSLVNRLGVLKRPMMARAFA